MDASDQPPSTKKRKLSSELAFDFISKLPDDVLHHIVAFLSTKDAIRTSALSTRWRYVWTSISKIKLVDDPSSNIKLSPDFVSRVLTLHDDSDIKQLCIQLSAPVDYSHLHLWIESAGYHNVTHLDLDLSLKEYFKLPNWLFTLHSLVELKLWFECILKTPRFTRFSDLTTLDLCKITFADKVSVRRLFLNCPVLDNLSLVNCEWRHIKKISICIPSLRSLTILHESQLPDQFNVLDYVIKIDTPNLKYLNFKSTLKVDFRLNNLSSLVHASVDIIWGHVADIAPRANRILKGISNVKYLGIADGFLYLVMSLQSEWSDYGIGIPEFYSLVHLKVTSGLDPYHSYLLLQFLDKSPNLKVLDLSKGLGFGVTGMTTSINSAEVPSCFNSCLRKITFSNFKAEQDEMELLEWLLENADVLETMVIEASDDLRTDRYKLKQVFNDLTELTMYSEYDGCIELHF